MHVSVDDGFISSPLYFTSSWSSLRLKVAMTVLVALLALFVLQLSSCVDGRSHSVLSRPSGRPSLPSTLAPHVRVSPLTGEQIAVPTASQLEWQEREISVLIHFNIATYLPTQYDGCGSSPTLLLPVSSFAPDRLNTDNWVASMLALGAKQAVLVAKHNCGFTSWPTAVRFNLSSGEPSAYNFSIQYSPAAGRDVVGELIASCHAASLRTGIYYSVGANNYLNVAYGTVRNATLAPGQVSISQSTYESIVLQQLTELWTTYGELDEIWFDGGFSPEQRQFLAQLIKQYQSAASVFGGCSSSGDCVTSSPLRWIGNEDGDAPDPNWSTGLGANGGDPNSPYFAPAECDTTLQQSDRWFYGAGVALRSLSDLVERYHISVGRNCLLQLDLSPDTHGLIAPDHAARYAQLGGVIRACYVEQRVQPSQPMQCSAQGLCLLTFDKPVTVDRVVLMEDQTRGQVIRGYTVDGLPAYAGSAAPPVPSWLSLSNGTSIGHKKIDVFSSPVTVTQLRFNVTRAADTPYLRSITTHLCGQIIQRAIEQSKKEDEKQAKRISDGSQRRSEHAIHNEQGGEA